MPRLTVPAPLLNAADFPATLAGRTRRLYDRVAPFYSISTRLFHSRAHQKLLEICGIADGMRVLEVATGSGEMFLRLVKTNPNGMNLGLDLSPNMAARTQRLARRQSPHSYVCCQAVDARQMPFRDSTFDLVVCCYLLELLAAEDIARTVEEFHRILRLHGRLALIVIGENTELFNRLYRIAGALAPAFWGRQVEHQVVDFIEAADFTVLHHQPVKQGLYPSRVLVARK